MAATNADSTAPTRPISRARENRSPSSGSSKPVAPPAPPTWSRKGSRTQIIPSSQRLADTEQLTIGTTATSHSGSTGSSNTSISRSLIPWERSIGGLMSEEDEGQEPRAHSTSPNPAGKKRQHYHHPHLRPLIPHLGRSDETPAGRIKHSPHSPPSTAGSLSPPPTRTTTTGSLSPPSRSLLLRRSPDSGFVDEDEGADEADDEKGGPLAIRQQQGRRGSRDETVASPSRKERFKRLIHKGSKFNLRAGTSAGGAAALVSSPSQELYAPRVKALSDIPTPTTPPREISSPASSSLAPLALSTRTAPRTPSPSPEASFELRPQRLLSSVSYGDDSSLLGSPGRKGKAARVLGEEIVPSGKAALVLGLEQKPLLVTQSPSTTSLLPAEPAAGATSLRSLHISSSTSKALPPPPPTPQHRRQRSASGPSAFASLEIPLTTPEVSSSNGEASSYLGAPGTLPSTRGDTPVGEVATARSRSGLATPPPSPPSAYQLPSAAETEDELPSVTKAKSGSRSKVASVASSTYAPSVYQGSDELPLPNRNRLTLDSIRFSSVFEGMNGFSSSSANGSQTRNSIALRTSNGGDSAVMRPAAASLTSSQLGQRPPLGTRSISASAVSRLRSDAAEKHVANSSSGEHSPASVQSRAPSVNGDGLSPLASRRSGHDSPFDPTELSPSHRAFPVRPRPKRTNTVGSVASVRTKKIQRSVALAALEGQPRPPVPVVAPPPAPSLVTAHRRSSYFPVARSEPAQPPPQGALPALPSGLTAPATPPPQTLRTSNVGASVVHSSASFLDFDASSEEDDVSTRHRTQKPVPPTAPTSRGGWLAPGDTHEGSAQSTRFSSLPFRQFESPMRQLASSRGGNGGLSPTAPFLRELELTRSRSSPILRPATPTSTLQPLSTTVHQEVHTRKGSNSSLGAQSMLSLSSDGDDDNDDEDQDWSSAFPRPPGT
ncbi:hypothetical protein JCM10908_007392 [Rhodotorula pacifica]|uniref:uncharacterized protein n=1 Tax=Rhodotorula pacifica TaxID=1495444 RepID=UPI00317A2C35